MEIFFANSKLEEICNNQKLLQKRFGQIGAKIIRRRLDDLRAVKNLEECKRLPGKYHQLVGDRTGQIAAHVEQPQRLIFRPIGTISENWQEITQVEILEIIDYHGK